jgi:hypothetical protein
MGTGASKETGSVSDPFRISRETDKDLDMLTFVTTRVLNTPDIYDVNNLSRAGTCGEYAVFMKDIIEKRLLNQFVVDTPEGKKEIYYQNPRKLITKVEDRKAICTQIASTAIQAVTTIVACLASIQVAYAPRMVPPQTGGNIYDVRDWLLKNDVIKTEVPKARVPVGLKVPDDLVKRGVQLFLSLDESRQDLTTGIVFVVRSTPGSTQQLPGGEGLRIQFLVPIRASQQADSMSVLPIRVNDSVNRPWMAGILVKYMNKVYFKSFGKSDMFNFAEGLDTLFRRETGGGSIQIESRDQIVAASGVFDQIRNNLSAGLIYLQTALGSFLPSVGFTTTAAPGPYGQPPAPYGYAQQPPAAPQNTYGFPAYPGAPVIPPPAAAATGPSILQPLAQPTFRQLPGATMVAAVGTTDTAYDIPTDATAFVLNAYKRFRDAHNSQSSPATVRAKTLAASVNEDRTVNVAACQDPYWTQSTLGQVYPWATFQYLCIKDLTKAGASPATTPHWSKFVSELGEVYEKLGLKLEKGMNPTPLLENMSVKGVSNLEACKTGKTGFRVIQDGLLRLQGLYEEHVETMWGILNSLVVVIEDPVRKARIVRLHPKAVSGPESSKKYIEALAEEARNAIGEFYIAVETTYVDTLKKAFPKPE